MSNRRDHWRVGETRFLGLRRRAALTVAAALLALAALGGGALLLLTDLDAIAVALISGTFATLVLCAQPLAMSHSFRAVERWLSSGIRKP